MKSVTATEAARAFSDLLDAVEREGERFVIVRHGRVVARLEPATVGTGKAVKDLLRRSPSDDDWLDEIHELRSSMQVEERRWND